AHHVIAPLSLHDALPIFKRDERFFAAHPQCQYVEDINNIFAQSDYISLHTPLNEQTRKIINKEVIEERIKKQAIIINTARGGLRSEEHTSELQSRENLVC